MKRFIRSSRALNGILAVCLSGITACPAPAYAGASQLQLPVPGPDGALLPAIDVAMREQVVASAVEAVEGAYAANERVVIQIQQELLTADPLFAQAFFHAVIPVVAGLKGKDVANLPLADALERMEDVLHFEIGTDGVVLDPAESRRVIAEALADLHGAAQTVAEEQSDAEIAPAETRTPFLNAIVEAFAAGAVKTLKWLGLVTAKPVDLGGSEGRTPATGYGVAYVADLAFKHLGYADGIAGKTTVVDAFGNVGSYSALWAAKRGAIVKGIKEWDASRGGTPEKPGEEFALIAKEGFSFTEDIVNEMMAYKSAHAGSLAGFHEVHPEMFEEVRGREAILTAFWGAGAQAYLVAPIGVSIGNEEAARIPADAVVVEGGNGPSTAEAIYLMEGRGTFVANDFFANSGGVMSSYFEMLQNGRGERWSEEEVFQALERYFDKKFAEIVEVQRAHEGYPALTFRQAAGVRAMDRILKARFPGGRFDSQVPLDITDSGAWQRILARREESRFNANRAFVEDTLNLASKAQEEVADASQWEAAKSFATAYDNLMASARFLRETDPLWRSLSDDQWDALVEDFFTPERVVTFEVGITRDDGTEFHAPAYRIVYDRAQGAGKGGIRWDAGAYLEKALMLSLDMVPKTDELGGAKGAVRYNPAEFSRAEQARIMRDYVNKVMDSVWEQDGELAFWIDQDVPAPDVATNAFHMQVLNEAVLEWIAAHPDPRVREQADWNELPESVRALYAPAATAVPEDTSETASEQAVLSDEPAAAKKEGHLKPIIAAAGITPNTIAQLFDGNHEIVKGRVKSTLEWEINRYNREVGGIPQLLERGGRATTPADAAKIVEPTAQEKLDFLRDVAAGKQAYVPFAGGFSTRMNVPDEYLPLFARLGIAGLTPRMMRALPQQESAAREEFDAVIEEVNRALDGEVSDADDLTVLLLHMVGIRRGLAAIREELAKDASIADQLPTIEELMDGIQFGVIVNAENMEHNARQIARFNFAGFRPENVKVYVQGTAGTERLLPDGTTEYQDDLIQFPEGHGDPLVNIRENPDGAFSIDAEGNLIPLGKSVLEAWREDGVERVAMGWEKDIDHWIDPVEEDSMVLAKRLMQEGGHGMVLEMNENPTYVVDAKGNRVTGLDVEALVERILDEAGEDGVASFLTADLPVNGLIDGAPPSEEAPYYLRRMKGGGSYLDVDGTVVLRDTIALLGDSALARYGYPAAGLSRGRYIISTEAWAGADFSKLPRYLRTRGVNGETHLAIEMLSGDASSVMIGSSADGEKKRGGTIIQKPGRPIWQLKTRPDLAKALPAIDRLNLKQDPTVAELVAHARSAGRPAGAETSVPAGSPATVLDFARDGGTHTWEELRNALNRSYATLLPDLRALRDLGLIRTDGRWKVDGQWNFDLKFSATPEALEMADEIYAVLADRDRGAISRISRGEYDAFLDDYEGRPGITSLLSQAQERIKSRAPNDGTWKVGIGPVAAANADVTVITNGGEASPGALPRAIAAAGGSQDPGAEIPMPDDTFLPVAVEVGRLADQLRRTAQAQTQA